MEILLHKVCGRPASRTMTLRAAGPEDAAAFYALQNEVRAAMPHPEQFVPDTLENIARYLKEVVLDPLPEEVLDFLVKTSFLSRLNAELCNAVTGRDDSKAMLAWIERHNLFLSALDEQGYWFRYHPLLQENLRTMLQQNNDIDRKQCI